MRSGFTTAQTVGVLKRNFYTAAFHGAASYWYDMGCNAGPYPELGCFGGALMPEATAAIWGNLSAMTKLILREAAARPGSSDDVNNNSPPRGNASGLLARSLAKGERPPALLEPEVAIFVQGVAGPSALLPGVPGAYCDGNIYK